MLMEKRHPGALVDAHGGGGEKPKKTHLKKKGAASVSGLGERVLCKYIKRLIRLVCLDNHREKVEKARSK